MKPRILIAEDEPDMLRLITTTLRTAGFEVLETGDGPGAIAEAQRKSPDLLVLDLMLPGMDGLEVCRTLKSGSQTAKIPVVMLTARAEEIDRIVGLELGADDYVTKPFSPRELVLRIKNILRRTQQPASEEAVLTSGAITIDRSRMEVTVHGKPVDLTATELKLLTLLVERRGRVQSREALLDEVWGYETAIDTRTVDTHIRRLREKLGKAAECLETVRGFGYRIADPR